MAADLTVPGSATSPQILEDRTGVPMRSSKIVPGYVLSSSDP